MPNLKASGNPTKAFFVRMITRDITLEDCILDLIDNSIDGAWKREGGRPTGLTHKSDLSAYEIRIQASPEIFSISDNCGGIPLLEAQDYAFTFGRRDDDAVDKFSIGVYGIGMKRAIFKIGSDIIVNSTHTTENGDRDSFSVLVDVEKWLGPKQSNDWDFPIKLVPPKSVDGVQILIKKLTDDSSTSFGNPAFLRTLKRTISRDYTLHLHHGIKIYLNGELIKGWQIELRSGGEFEPQRISYDEDGGLVKVELLGGMSSPPPDGDGPEDTEGGDRFGWYVVCNGRVVLAADKTANSGWGTDGWPAWHGQYNGFIGLILFSSENAALLPMTTTKRNVDLSSGVYRRAQPKMRDLSKQWIAYTNARRNAPELARAAELQSKPVSMFALAVRREISLPRIIVEKKEPVANISYSVKLPTFKKLAAALGNINMGYRELGIKCFDYTYDDHVGDE